MASSKALLVSKRYNVALSCEKNCYSVPVLRVLCALHVFRRESLDRQEHTLLCFTASFMLFDCLGCRNFSSKNTFCSVHHPFDHLMMGFQLANVTLQSLWTIFVRTLEGFLDANDNAKGLVIIQMLGNFLQILRHLEWWTLFAAIQPLVTVVVGKKVRLQTNECCH